MYILISQDVIVVASRSIVWNDLAYIAVHGSSLSVIIKVRINLSECTSRAMQTLLSDTYAVH